MLRVSTFRELSPMLAGRSVGDAVAIESFLPL